MINLHINNTFFIKIVYNKLKKQFDRKAGIEYGDLAS
jgi:hypothetical protein